MKLLKVTTPEQAADWLKLLQEFYLTYGDWLNERTHRADVPAHAIPKHIRPNQKWQVTPTKPIALLRSSWKPWPAMGICLPILIHQQRLTGW
ncbi:hypothetical protein AUO95_09930 [Corynebacterium glutamicum]|nr:hypothetical protein AUO95_09930 [Corynebacterium glutamicum]